MTNKYLRDERTIPRVAALLQMCAYVLDAETPEELEFFKNLSAAFFGSDPRRIKWGDPDDPESNETHLTRHDAAATAKAREVWGAILGEKPGGLET